MSYGQTTGLESRGSEGVDEGSSVRREKRQVKKDTHNR